MRARFLTLLLVLTLALFVGTDVTFVWDKQEAFRPSDTAVHLVFQIAAILLIVWQSVVSYRAWRLPQRFQLALARNFLVLLVTLIGFFFIFQPYSRAYWYATPSELNSLVIWGMGGLLVFGCVVVFVVRRSMRLTADHRSSL